MELRLLFYINVVLLFRYVRSQCAIKEVRAQNVTSTSVTLTWDTAGPCFIKEYSIEAEHVRFKACPVLDIGKGPIKATANSSTVFDLEPFSDYKFRVRGINNDGAVILSSDLVVETMPDRPQLRPRNGETRTYTQAVHFNWEAPQPQLDEATCQKQRGQIDGYFVQLYALDPWASGLVVNASLGENIPQFYVQHLKPFTSYKLMVFIKNKGNLFNPDLPLVLEAKTRPYIPDPPVNLKATATSPNDIYLRWQPSYPPTGLVEKFKVRYGPKPAEDEETDWKHELEVANLQNSSTNLCSKMSQKENLVCVRVSGLQANTSYIFQVQAYNANYSQPSAFSLTFEATTDPSSPEEPQVIPTSEEATPFTNTNNNSSNEAPSTHVAIIIVSLIVIVILVIVVAALVYKLQMHKLQMRYDARQRQLQSEFGRSLSISALGSYYPTGNESIGMNTSMVTVAYHIETIQKRKLPEPPREGDVDDENHYANSTLGPDLIPRGRTSTPMLKTTSEECTDIDGYLKPTFNNAIEERKQPPLEAAKADFCTTVIPIESYVSSVTLDSHDHALQPERTTSPSIISTGSSSLRPLIRKS